MTLASPVSGQGDGAVQFTVAAHADPTARATAIAVEDRRLQVSQEGRPCSVHLSSTLEAVEASGGERMVRVEASSSQCRWTAVADVPWITIVSGREGNGSGTVGFRVDGASGAPRSGTITIAGQVVQVEQGRGCIYSVAADTFTLGAAGGSGDIQVSAPAGCSWTAESRVAWITLAGGTTGTGPGVVGFRVAATDGPARTGTLTVAGRVVTITQSPICAVVVEPLTYSVPAAGGTGALSIRADAGCAWTATTSSDWIVFNVGQGGKGDGQLRFTVAANSGQARSGVVSLAGQTVTVTQASACTFTLTPSSVSVGAAASAATIQVAGPQNCPWSATTTASWIMLGDTASGSGNGQVQVSFTANPGPARSGVVSLAGQTATVMQAGGCTVTVAPPSVSVGAAASAAAIQVAAPQGCAWSATTATSWITLGDAASGTGNGQVPVSFAANSGPAREGSLTIGGRDIPVTQASGCTVTVAPPSVSVGAAASAATIQVTAAQGCAWSATTATSWITLGDAASGTGNGQVPVSFAANSGPAREGSLTIGGRDIPVTQASGCTFTIAPPSVSVGAAASAGAFQVTAAQGCAWSATTATSWIVLGEPASGTGNGQVPVSFAANSGPAREGSLTIGGRDIPVTQASGCTFTVSPPSVSVGAAASAGAFQVATAEGCPWSATTATSWIVLGEPKSGTGNGQVPVSFAANSGPAREGSLTIGGRDIPVTQASGCTFTVSPPSVSVGAAASAGAFQVATAEGCPWSATTATSWIVLGEPKSGTGNGQVPVSFAANSGPTRQGSLTIGGRDIPVAQASGCTYSVSPPGQDVAGAGGTGAALVATAAGCPWTASSNAQWITASITTGVGPGQVPFTVAANSSPARTGTLTVAGQVFTVNQASLCTWTFSPPFHAFDAAGGNGNVLVIVSGSCSWTAASNVPWIVLTAGSSGTGGGLVQFVAAPNSGPARTGSLTIAGTRYDVVQAGR